MYRHDITFFSIFYSISCWPNNKTQPKYKLHPTMEDETLTHKNQNKTYTRVFSHAQDELHSVRTYLSWMCVDQSTYFNTFLSWFVFLIFAIIVPAISHFYLTCPSCDAKHKQPYDAVVQLSLTSIATLSFLCLTYFSRKYGVRRFLFFDKLVNESDSVRHHYTTQLNVWSLFLLIILFYFFELKVELFWWVLICLMSNWLNWVYVVF